MDLATPLLTYGPLGIAVVAQSFVIIRLYNRIEAIQKEKETILETWRSEIKEGGREALEIVRGNSQATMYLADKIEVGKESDIRRAR